MIVRHEQVQSSKSHAFICKTRIFCKKIRQNLSRLDNQVRILELFRVLEILIVIDKCAEKDFNVIGDVFVCTKSLHLVKKFQDANVCHEKDLEQFAESWQK